jgi:(E)-4-hydroxy-3-methylbut-2-enyl-diphosphate synthase
MQSFDYISRVVRIGDVPMGGNFPIRVQSMTTTNTLDTRATVAQAIRMIEAGCEYVRITAQGIKEAEHLAIIKKELKKQGYITPLIADIHYNPQAAEIAARIVEKVRINPGNYVDRKRGRLSYSVAEYFTETEKIRDRIKPLISICKQYGTVIRIGSNHGSLSERILLKYGDTPHGMVESALEFMHICEDLDFHEIVLSMKASNVKIMVQANRLLVKRLIEEGTNYPIHLGVTEAGDAEDGRIKSSAGIGPLLEDGIGDTIRVSLTEDPEFEIPVAKALVAKFNYKDKRCSFSKIENEISDPISCSRKITVPLETIGNGQVPVVITSSDFKPSDHLSFEKDFVPDYFFNSEKGILQKLAYSNDELAIKSSKIKLVFIESAGELEKVSSQFPPDAVMILKTDYTQPLHKLRLIMNLLANKGINQPVIMFRDYTDLSEDKLIVQASSDFAFLLVDGLLDGIWISNKKTDLISLNRIAFGILQATGSRITKTEYIACPSCGRTLFKIQDTLKKIKVRTSHLKGLKIGVMGCCVNGPGEMADADYGYVGAGKGKITLYRRKQIIRAGIPEEEAVEALVDLIKLNGDWI